MPSSSPFSFANTLPILLLLSTVSGCSPTAPSSDPTKTDPVCCEPLKVLGSTRFRSGHLLVQYDQPKHKCLTSVRLHCMDACHSHRHRREAAILDSNGRFLTIGRRKTNLEGICQQSDGKWRWRLGSARADTAEVRCVVAAHHHHRKHHRHCKRKGGSSGESGSHEKSREYGWPKGNNCEH